MDLVDIEQGILDILKSQGYDDSSLTTSSVPCELFNLSLKDDTKLLTKLSEHVGFNLNSLMGHLFTSFTHRPGREYLYSVHEAAIIVHKLLQITWVTYWEDSKLTIAKS
jgi:hypothetical protein